MSSVKNLLGTDIELQSGTKTVSTLEKTKVLGDFPKVLTVFFESTEWCEAYNCSS